MATPATNRIEVNLYRGKDIYLKTVQAKVFAHVVSFKEQDPSKPVVWLGQKSYTTFNMNNKKTTLYYDTLTGMLFKPKDMGSGEDNVDMVMQTSQNVLLAGNEAKNALGIQESKQSVFNFAMAMIIILAILFMVFLYMFYSNPPAPVSHATTTMIQGLIPGAGGLVPTSSSPTTTLPASPSGG